MEQYTVEDGESCYSISQKVYGTGIRYIDIYEINQTIIGPDPNIIKTGMILSLPPQDAERFHEVVEGESLWTIAKKYLGKSSRFEEIFELNSESISDEENKTIYPGQILLLPKL